MLEVLENFVFDDDNYYTMALFVRFLLDRHGVPPFAGFMREAERYDRPADYAASFRAHFGEDLEAAIAAFDDSYPTCSRWNNRIALLECADPAPWVDGQVTFHFDLRYDSPHQHRGLLAVASREFALARLAPRLAVTRLSCGMPVRDACRAA